MCSFIEACDGAILSTAEALEPEGVALIRDWFSETGREVYAVGPLLPLGTNTVAGEQSQSDKPSEIDTFLKTTLETHGPKSLLYVSREDRKLISSSHFVLFRSRSVRFTGQVNHRSYGPYWT